MGEFRKHQKGLRAHIASAPHPAFHDGDRTALFMRTRSQQMANVSSRRLNVYWLGAAPGFVNRNKDMTKLSTDANNRPSVVRNRR